MEQAVRKIALLGMGTVGGGVYEIIEKQKEEMPFKLGAALEVVKVLVRNKAKYADRIPAASGHWAHPSVRNTSCRSLPLMRA